MKTAFFVKETTYFFFQKVMNFHGE